MAIAGGSLACEESFADINRIFAKGVPPEIAAALDEENAKKKNVAELYTIDISDFDEGKMRHFEKDWLGFEGNPWFTEEAGQALYKAFVHALKVANDRKVKGIWVERNDVTVQVMEDDELVLVILGAPTSYATPCSSTCGTLFTS